MRNTRPILLVEDDEGYRMMALRAFHSFGIGHLLLTAENGKEAMELLRNNPVEMPALVLLSLNNPRPDGIRFLREMKSDEMLRAIPVIVLTTSNESADKRECFQLGVAGYIVKPRDHRGFEEVLAVMDWYWTVSELPDLHCTEPGGVER